MKSQNTPTSIGPLVADGDELEHRDPRRARRPPLAVREAVTESSNSDAPALKGATPAATAPVTAFGAEITLRPDRWTGQQSARLHETRHLRRGADDARCGRAASARRRAIGALPPPASVKSSRDALTAPIHATERCARMRPIDPGRYCFPWKRSSPVGWSDTRSSRAASVCRRRPLRPMRERGTYALRRRSARPGSQTAGGVQLFAGCK